jgi:hypothetical protein
MKHNNQFSLHDHYESGYKSFFRAEQNKKGHWFAIANRLKPNTTPAREWQRGWDKAYLDNLEKLNGNGAKT